ncbi:MAG: hypothetical protein JJU02_08785 [Cryomorphaceae bacterium]|nr:hypothetical protein [Cryomorphaceae bacterium]
MKTKIKTPNVLAIRKFLPQSDIPFIVYAVVFFTMFLVWVFRYLHPDLTLNIFSELLGAAFTLFIIDTLLVRTKTKRWKEVQQHVNYLIGRNVYRIRDGISTRAFAFDPEIDEETKEYGSPDSVREQRAAFLSDLEKAGPQKLIQILYEEELFTESNYQYFNEKADDIWKIVNMRYSDYLPPDLVHVLIVLHTHLKDVGAYIRLYRKSIRFPAEATFYKNLGRSNIATTLHEVIKILNFLYNEGLSEVSGSDAA